MPLPDDYIADNNSASIARPATIPTPIARIVTIHKFAPLLIMAAPSTPILRGSHRRQDRQQEQTQQNQNYLAIAFHQTHNTSIARNNNLLPRE
jgi:mannosyltransferase OCH1-like enzyme